jgi:hypothetical protein
VKRFAVVECPVRRKNYNSKCSHTFNITLIQYGEVEILDKITSAVDTQLSESNPWMIKPDIL